MTYDERRRLVNDKRRKQGRLLVPFFALIIGMFLLLASCDAKVPEALRQPNPSPTATEQVVTADTAITLFHELTRPAIESGDGQQWEDVIAGFQAQTGCEVGVGAIGRFPGDPAFDSQVLAEVEAKLTELRAANPGAAVKADVWKSEDGSTTFAHIAVVTC